IVVLSTLRKIKEKHLLGNLHHCNFICMTIRVKMVYILLTIQASYLVILIFSGVGRAVQDDLVIITGHEKTSYTDVETTATDVKHAITAVLTDELGLEVFVGPESRPPVSSKLRAPSRPRRPQGMIKITVNSLNHWLKRKSARDVQ
uniref:Uncharacterized protein n=1 Tax=Aegilops tauschii subsp. strangulata TaxID=200361 RepID=A0A452XFJ2_AEGTS